MHAAALCITRTNILIEEFIKGRHGNLTNTDKSFMTEIKEDIGFGQSFTDRSMQYCKNLFISISFRGMKLTWNQLPPEETFGPYVYQTDFGSCCLLVPHLHLDLRPSSEYENMSTYEIYHDLKADTLNGEANGLDVVIDAEQFNYAYHQSNAAGFKVSLHHHLDLPMMQFSSQLIFTGVETQINLKPTITNTTKEAIPFLSPKERQCYTEGEANLTYLKKEYGFRYELNNCIIDQGIRDIIWNCRCMPSFYGYGSDYLLYLDYIPLCFGEKLLCANTRSKSMGIKMVVSENNVTVPEAMKNPNFIGNISKPDPIHCMPACAVQENNNQMSFAPYPQLGNFFYQKTFCNMASHIWKDTCQKENREYFLRKDQPVLCQVLKNFTQYFGEAGVKVRNTTVRTPTLESGIVVPPGNLPLI